MKNNTKEYNKAQNKTILVACGGTGGHLLPGILVGRQLAAKTGASVLYLVNDKKVTKYFVDEVQSELIMAPELVFKFSSISNIIKMILNFFKVIGIVLNLVFKCNLKLVVTAGGGAGIIPVILSRILGIRSVLLEQNVIMGKANRLLLKFADYAYISFPCINIKETRKIKMTGNPIREDFFKNKTDRKTAALKLNLDPDTFTLLFIGGSQGASKINSLAMNIVADILKLRGKIQVIHLSGAILNKELDDFYKALGIKYHCREFSKDMLEIYTLSDFAFSRAGGGVMTELLYFNIPAVLIPFPYAAEDHQKFNAEYIASKKLGWFVSESDIEKGSGKDRIMAILNNENEIQSVRKNLELLSKTSSAEVIALDIQKNYFNKTESRQLKADS